MAVRLSALGAARSSPPPRRQVDSGVSFVFEAVSTPEPECGYDD
jgi:hypothetical protein